MEQPAAASSAQQAPSAGTPVAVGQVPPGAPTSRLELNALRARRSELSDQLISAQGRRKSVAAQLRDATTPVDRGGLEDRLRVLDQRIAQLERDIDETGRQISSAPAALVSTTAVPPGGLSSGQVTAISLVAIVTIAAPIVVAVLIRWLRRGTRPVPAPVRHELTARLDRLEQGMEAIAIEIERISEGQRFVNKLLGEGAATPLATSRGEGELTHLRASERSGT
jgi:hypothetical protein